MSKTVRIPHNKIDTPNKVTPVTETAFKEAGLDCRVNEAVKFDDDFSTGERIFEVKNTEYYFRNSPEYKMNYEGIKKACGCFMGKCTCPSLHSAEGPNI